jgi:isopentenyl-diphosphate delta-isomerase
MTPPEHNLAITSIDPSRRDRKAEHIELALETRMQMTRNFFDDLRFEHQAFPEIDLEAIDLSVEFLGKRLDAPLLISCMTGGTEEATRINRNLARAAQETGIAVGVGSQRKALEDASTEESFRIRPFAPGVPILANLGAVQLNYGFGLDECDRAVKMIDADALVFHANALQEALQPEGQTNFDALIPKMGDIARTLDIPVIVKEVGCGIDPRTAHRLIAEGIRIVDTAGTGGTSWARIEAARSGDLAIGELFADWGIPTPLAVRRLRKIRGLTIIGSGGVRNGIDVAKAIASGADLVGMAYPFLRVATESKERVVERARRIVQELKICMFCVGARDVKELQSVPLIRRDEWS